MDQNFGFDEYVVQDQLLFGMDGDRGEVDMISPGLQFDHMYQSVNQVGLPADLSYSTSPGLPIAQTYPFPNHVSGSSFLWNNELVAESPYQSFSESFNHPKDQSAYNFSGWTSPSTLQYSPSATLSSPRNIPGQVEQLALNDLKLSEGASLSPFGQSSSGSSNTMSRTESVASYETALEEPIQSFNQRARSSSGSLATSPLAMVQYRHNNRTNRLAPDTGMGRRNPKGRKGPLNDAQRRATAKMREIGACPSCRDRKAKCDPGIPCQQCINYYKCNLIHHPCRGKQLEHIADKLLRGHIFPRKRPLNEYLGHKFQTSPNNFIVHLELGFGSSLPWPAQVVSPYNQVKFAKELLHQHVEYEWPTHHNYPTQRTERKHWVFPALLTNISELKTAVDLHLTSLVDDRNNWKHFPLYNSPLEVLNHIYEYYLDLSEHGEDRQAKALLRQAFKLLILIHIGGDTRISPNQDSRYIIDNFFSPEVHEKDVTPCFIRGQLGEVFSKLAVEYAKSVLSQLESECLNKDCRRFAPIVSTFMVLFMAVESVQYHTAKDTYHFYYDGQNRSTGPSNDEIEGIIDLLEFYKNCFSGCHKDRLLEETDLLAPIDNGKRPVGAGELAILRVRAGVKQAKNYLLERSKESLSTRGGDITVFFDRLVARLLLLQG